MAKTKDVSLMVSGMGMGLRFLAQIAESIERNGGHIEMLHRLGTELGKEDLEKVGAFIAQLPWKIPVSVIRQAVRKTAEYNFPGDPETQQNEVDFLWNHVLKDEFNVPLVLFDDDDFYWDDDHLGVIPPEIREQLHGCTAASALQINWEGRRYTVIELWTLDDEPDVKVGDVINGSMIRAVGLTLSEHLALDQ